MNCMFKIFILTPNRLPKILDKEVISKNKNTYYCQEWNRLIGKCGLSVELYLLAEEGRKKDEYKSQLINMLNQFRNSCGEQTLFHTQ